MTNFKYLPAILLLLVVAPLAALSAEPSDPPPGFESIFNGTDLSEWDGNPKYWSVEDGCLTGVTDGKLKHNRFITWRGQPPNNFELRNFELRVQVKITDRGNSGLNYRSQPYHSQQGPDLGEEVVTGYQCDVVPKRPEYNGMLYEERGRRILARTGERVIIDTAGQPWVVAPLREKETRLEMKEFPLNEFHEYRILVEGNHHQHWIDGHQTVDVIDLDEEHRALSGILAVQVHVGPPMKIQCRDFFLKRLPDDSPIISPEEATIPADAVKVVPQ